MLDSHGKMLKMLRGMQHVLDPPVTVKFRTGVKDNHPTAHKLIPKLESVVSGLPVKSLPFLPKLKFLCLLQGIRMGTVSSINF